MDSRERRSPEQIEISEQELESEAHVTTAAEDERFLENALYVTPDRVFELNNGKAIPDLEALELLARPETHRDFIVLAKTQKGLKPLPELKPNDLVDEIQISNKQFPKRAIPLALSKSARYILQEMVSQGLDITKTGNVKRYIDERSAKREV